MASGSYVADEEVCRITGASKNVVVVRFKKPSPANVKKMISTGALSATGDCVRPYDKGLWAFEIRDQLGEKKVPIIAVYDAALKGGNQFCDWIFIFPAHGTLMLEIADLCDDIEFWGCKIEYKLEKNWLVPGRTVIQEEIEIWYDQPNDLALFIAGPHGGCFDNMCDEYGNPRRHVLAQ